MMNLHVGDFGSPERLIELAKCGRFTKEELTTLLSAGKRHEYLEMCAGIEKRLTEACTATGDPCLEGGCSADGEVCLQPVLLAGLDYTQACGSAFATLFADPRNRNGF